MTIPFNRPYQSANELQYIAEVLKSGKLSGNNTFFKKVEEHIFAKHKLKNLFLVPSGTSALEMGAWLSGLAQGDEVILPSYTFSSTANAILLTGAKPVFCEVYPETMNADAEHMESLITEKTKMLLPIDYAGIPCAIDKMQSIADKYNLTLMIDAAQSYGSYFNEKPCGVFGDLSTFSFHETKNISCGEGGALIVNKEEWIERAHFLQEKGTDRRLVLFGQKAKYHWVDIGSSYLLSDILAGVLYSQLQSEADILSLRKKVTDAYFNLFLAYRDKGFVSVTPYDCYDKVNSHAFWVIFDTDSNKENFIMGLKEHNVYAYIGYMPLHSAPMGIKFGYKPQDLPITQDLASRLVRLPLYADLANEGLEYCLDCIAAQLKRIYGE